MTEKLLENLRKWHNGELTYIELRAKLPSNVPQELITAIFEAGVTHGRVIASEERKWENNYE